MMVNKPSVSLMMTELISLELYSLFVAAVMRRFFRKKIAFIANAEVLPASIASYATNSHKMCSTMLIAGIKSANADIFSVSEIE